MATVKSSAAQILSGLTQDRLRQVANPIGVTVICGFPASGKSTATAHLARQLNAVVLDKDTYAPRLEEAIMVELGGNRYDRDSEVYHRVVAPNLYDSLVSTALAVGARYPVLVDAPFLAYIRAAAAAGVSLADHIRTVASAPTAEVHTIWVASTPEQIRRRMQDRAADRDQTKIADWDHYCANVLNSGLEHAARTVVDHVVVN